MATRNHTRRTQVLGLSVLALAAVGSLAHAQDGGPPPGGRGGFQRGGPGNRMGPREMTVVSAPIGALDASLKLTADQKDKIMALQQQFQQQRREMTPPPPDGQGGPPDFQAMQANREKVQALEQQTGKQIEAILTPEQKKLLPAALKELQAMEMAGIPAPIVADLKLTADQKSKIAAIAQRSQADMQSKMRDAQQSGDFGAMRGMMQENRRQTHDRVFALLTDAQKAQVDTYVQAHPQPNRGGFGGPGGRPPRDMPPPPGDMPPAPPADSSAV